MTYSWMHLAFWWSEFGFDAVNLIRIAVDLDDNYVRGPI